MPDKDINLSDDRKDENEGQVTSRVTSVDAGARGGGGVHPPDPMTAMMNAMYSDTAGLMLVCLGFEAVAMHRFVFQEMMSRPNNILRLDDKRVDQIVTVACKTG